MTTLEVRDLTLSNPILTLWDIKISINNDRTGVVVVNEEVFIPVILLRWTPPCFVLINLDRGTDTVSMGIAELTTRTVLVAECGDKLIFWERQKTVFNKRLSCECNGFHLKKRNYRTKMQQGTCSSLIIALNTEYTKQQKENRNSPARWKTLNRNELLTN